MNVRWLVAMAAVVGCGNADSGGGDTRLSPVDGGMLGDGAIVSNINPVAVANDASISNVDAQLPEPTTERIDQCGSDNPAKLSTAEIASLKGAAKGAALKWLYPFDGTVFPRGLRPPQLMWADGVEARAVYVTITSKSFEYQGCLTPSANGRVAIPEEVWKKLSAQGHGLKEPFKIELRELDRQGVVRGPVQSSFVVAEGSLKGSIFYNSYASNLAMKQGAPGGAVLRIRAGQDAEVFAGQRGCVGCHAVSANGSRLVASNLADTTNNEGVYPLTPTTPNNPPSLRRATDFVALSPDGKVYVTGQSQYNGEQAGLYVTDTGERIANSELRESMLSHPMFSPTGTLLAFNDVPVNTGEIVGSRIALMDYDATARRFSNYRTVIESIEYGADWPNLLPDNRAIVYADTSRQQLRMVDIATKKSFVLARAMGFATPAEAEQSSVSMAHDGYYPTLVPVAVGGFYWVFFDSYRAYGNIAATQVNPFPIDPGPGAPPPVPADDMPDWLRALLGLPPKQPNPNPQPQPQPQPQPEAYGSSRQLWGAAIEISPDGSYKVDPSHPPFYLDGQELGTNNHRAFAALDPCSARGTSCQSGIDCCDGFCENGMCVATPSRCAKAEEACKVQTDCCDASNACINGFCSVVATPLL